MSKFVYSPVDSASSQIRLLTIPKDVRQILGRSSVAPLTGRLQNCYLPVSTLSRTQRILRSSQLPTFYALSYVWGNSAEKREIMVDGNSVGISRNLYDALRAMQKDAVGDVRVWADAICICQEDLDERSAQILLMREIYHAATEVRIWLGPGSENGTRCLQFIQSLTGAPALVWDPSETENDAIEEAAMQVMTVTAGGLARGLLRTGEAFIQIGEIIGPPARDDKAQLLLDPDQNLSLHQESIESISKWRPSSRRLAKVKDEGDFSDIANLIDRVFLWSDWFSRMWVVQEAGVAKSAEILLGGVSIGWKYVIRAIYYLHFVRGVHFEHIRRVTGLEKIRLGWNEGLRQPLRDLIYECRYREASDPRDKIYSLLGLMGDQINHFLQPNYMATVGKVYSNAACHFISQAHSLDPLCGWQIYGRHEDSSWKVPSWVPDYTLDQDHAPSPLVAIDGRDGIYAASGYDYRSKVENLESMISPSAEGLRCLGLYIDQIEVLSGAGPDSEHFGLTSTRWRNTLLEAGHSLTGLTEDTKVSLCQITSVIMKYSEYLRNPSHPPASTITQFDGSALGNAIVNAYIHTMFSGRMSARERVTDEFLESIFKLTSLSNAPDSTAEAREAACKALEAGMRRRKLAITKNGYIGAVPNETQVGEVVCVLFGCSVPVVLRRTLDQSYTFVGETYLHGFMDAEAIAFQVKCVFKEQEFLLV